MNSFYSSYPGLLSLKPVPWISRLTPLVWTSRASGFLPTLPSLLSITETLCLGLLLLPLTGSSAPVLYVCPHLRQNQQSLLSEISQGLVIPLLKRF